MPRYSDQQKDLVIQKLLQPNPPSALSLSEKFGISSVTISRWLKDFQKKNNIDMKKRPIDWTAEERFDAVMKTSSMTAEEIGAFVRQQGILLQQLKEWKLECIQAMGKRPGRTPDPEKRDLKREIKLLKIDLNRKEKALAETAALLVLKKKAQFLWEEEEESPYL